MADTHGKVVALFERDCSIQRRHQKVVEEAPSPGAHAASSASGWAARRSRRREAIGYVGAGTVEFLLTPDGEFFFLEVNTRLQVEHPVTEAVTGLDLVRLQIRVAEGRPLPPEAIEPVMEGHAIEVRLYAEDPANDFLPVTGTLERFAISDGLRVDTGVESGTEVSPYYDPMLAKVIAHGARRDGGRASARRRGLARAEITGSSPTATSSCGCCATPSSSKVAPTRTSSSATNPPSSGRPPSTRRPRACTPPPRRWPSRSAAGARPACWAPSRAAGATTRPGCRG